MSDPESHTAQERHPGIDADFGRRLDLWASYQRIGLSTVGLVVVLLVTPEATWVQLLVGVYATGSIFIPWLMNERRSEAFKARVRLALLCEDLFVVSSVAYGWGTHTSPAVFMYLPIVVFFTLVPQRGLGRLALLLSIGVVGATLLLEASQLLPYAPLRIAETPLDSSRLLFFALFASALAAVQNGVESTVARMRDHARSASKLAAEKERHERELELSAQLEEAARLESLGRLSGGIAHDFNNLLMALLGHAELARQKLRTDLAFVDAALSDIERAAENGRALTTQLLDFASRRPARFEVVELNQALRGAEKLLTRLLRRTVKLELLLCDEPCYVRIDPSSLERVLFNLAVNASDAMPEGGLLRLRLARENAGKEGARALLSMEDQGTGIAAEDLPHIFEPFFTKKERGKGTGLGLSSVYGIMRQNHGEIDVTSTPGVGTTFFLRFPLTAAPEPAKAPVPETRAKASGRILLVDDNELVRGVVRAQLESAGYDVKVASSADEALGLLDQAANFDLLVSDVVMPRVSGIELAKQTRERLGALPILLVSGYAAELSLDTLDALGVRLLLKPFGTKQLLQAVTESLSRR
jgi:signal transduction histidine kinase/CheY-like chemotaxis protein